MNLGNTSAIVQIVTASAVTIDVTAHWTDSMPPARNVGPYISDSKTYNITGATTTKVVSAPDANVKRRVDLLSARNKHASSKKVM